MSRSFRSQRTAALVQSEIRAMTRACNELGGVNLGQGICDVPTPEPIKQAACRAIAEDRSIYTRHDGDAVLREAIARKMLRHNRVAVDAETEVVVTIGASGAFAATLMALFDPGDELLLFEPYYGYHLNTALVAGLVPRLLPLSPPDFGVDLEQVGAAITPRTRAMLICTPCNPTGKVFTRAELAALGAICQQHDLLCITDEVYEYIVYPGAEHVSMMSLPGMRDRCVLLGSFSKTFNITGWRIGFAVASAPLAHAIGLVNDLYYVCAPAPLQHAVAHALDTFAAEYYEHLATDYLAKREQFCAVLRTIGMAPIVPAGAYYVLADTARLGCSSSREAAMRLLRESLVAAVAGSAFYSDARGEQLIRFCYAKRQTDLDRACELLLDWHRRH